jgi:hypothetical protein
MRNLLPRYFDLPIALCVAGALFSIGIMLLFPDAADYQPALSWIPNIWYLALSLAATEAVIHTIFTRPQEESHLDIKQLHLQFIVRNMMIGIILVVCDWSPELENFADAIQYFTVRLGTTLLLLGALVMLVAHKRMKEL